jgi:hypothetical protein
MPECVVSTSRSGDPESGAWERYRRFIAEGQQFVLEGRGTVVAARQVNPGSTPRRGGGPRGSVSKFSSQSSKHLMFAVNAIPWDSISKERLFLLGVTDVRPQAHRGRTSKKCLDVLYRRLEGFFGPDGYWAVWKQEYERNGTWHGHILLAVLRLPKRPARRYGAAPEDLPPAEFAQDFADWLARTWAKVLGVAGRDDLHEISYCKSMRNVRKVAKYVMKGPFGGVKAYETRAPTGVAADGRWWGSWHRKCVPLEAEYLTMSADEFWQVRRILREVPARRSHGRFRPGVWRSTSRMDIVSDGRDLQVFWQLVRYVEDSRQQAEDRCTTHRRVGVNPNDALPEEAFDSPGNAYAVVDERFGTRVLTLEGDRNE